VHPTHQTQNTLLRGGTVWTGVPGEGVHEAVALAGGYVVALGSAAEAWAVDNDAQTIELAGGFVMPAFGEGHAHPVFGALESDGPLIRELDTIEAIVAEVARWAAANPTEPWVIGGSYDNSLAPDGLFDARWLDEVVADRPVMLRARDYHTLWCNTLALELAGITAETADPSLGEIPRRGDGSALGTLREWGAVDLMLAVAPKYPLARRVAALGRATGFYASRGFTWLQDAWVEADEVDVYLEAAAQGLLATRCNLALRADPQRWPEQLPELIAARAKIRALAHPLLTADTVKFFADGVIESGTAALIEPYVGHSHDHGISVWEPAALSAAVEAIDAAGFQTFVHAIGDLAVRQALDAIENAVAINGPRDRRPVLTHIQLIDPQDVPRFQALGVIVNAQPLWAQLDDLMVVLTIPRLGDERAGRQYAFATLADTGATLSFGSDWPCSSALPFEGILVGTTRQTTGLVPDGGWIPGERLDIDAALSAYTAGVAVQAFADTTALPWGTLAPGLSADLTWLDSDPRKLAGTPGLATIGVRGTWLAGTRTFTAQ